MNAPHRSTQLEPYFREAGDWAESQLHSAHRSRRRAYAFAALCLAIALASIGVLATLFPLKQAIPIVLEVDRATGVVDVRTLTERNQETLKSLTEEEAITQSLMVRYVTARETYDKSDLNALFDDVQLLSAPDAFDPYDRLFRDDKRSPFKVYGDSVRSIRVKSVTFLNNQTAAVRYSAELRKSIGSDTTHWVSIVTFRYVQAPLSLEERWANPLGFQVLNYRADQESL